LGFDFHPAETSNRRTWAYCRPDANRFLPKAKAMIALQNKAK